MAGNNDVHRGPSKDKRIRAAFVRLYDADPNKLDELALAAHMQAVAGDPGAVSAMGFIRDTLDGKPAQALIGGDDDEPAVKVDAVIRRIIVKPEGGDDGLGGTGSST